jgi:hypothetical protein
VSFFICGLPIFPAHDLDRRFADAFALAVIINSGESVGVFPAISGPVPRVESQIPHS